jgi:hypothetical protein
MNSPDLKPGEEIMQKIYNIRTGEPELEICKSPLRKAEFCETLSGAFHQQCPKILKIYEGDPAPAQIIWK